MVTKDQKEEEYTLKESRKKVGALLPCLEDKFGHLVDGFHRREVDPDWWAVKNPNIDTPAKRAIARLLANWHRRQLDYQEKSQGLAEIARLTGWNPKEMAENLSVTERTIYRYLPSSLKREYIQKRVKSDRLSKSSIVEESRELAKLMEEIVPSTEIVEDSLEEELKTEIGKPLLPYPDCACGKCPHYKQCRFLWG